MDNQRDAKLVEGCALYTGGRSHGTWCSDSAFGAQHPLIIFHNTKEYNVGDCGSSLLLPRRSKRVLARHRRLDRVVGLRGYQLFQLWAFWMYMTLSGAEALAVVCFMYMVFFVALTKRPEWFDEGLTWS